MDKLNKRKLNKRNLLVAMKFKEVLTKAVIDIAINGFDSQSRIDRWMKALRNALIQEMQPDHVIKQKLDDAMGDIFKRLVTSPTAITKHKGVSKFTIDKVKPELRGELTRRIATSANLITLNREQMIERTMQRFQGWGSSIPNGGSDVVAKREVKANIAKPLASLPFEERRVMIDQGHKLTANINAVVAEGGGAIAAIWHSRFRQANYNYRVDHKERDDKIYAIRGNWAMEDGLMKVGVAGYTDQITMPAEEIYCRCSYEYIYSLRKLPKEMLTKKGLELI